MLRGGVAVKLAVDAHRQLSCVLLREPWRMALFDMAEAEEVEEDACNDKDLAGLENMEDDEESGELSWERGRDQEAQESV